MTARERRIGKAREQIRVALAAALDARERGEEDTARAWQGAAWDFFSTIRIVDADGRAHDAVCRPANAGLRPDPTVPLAVWAERLAPACEFGAAGSVEGTDTYTASAAEPVARRA